MGFYTCPAKKIGAGSWYGFWVSRHHWLEQLSWGWGGRQDARNWNLPITDSMDMSLGKLRELVMDREAWRAVIHGATKSRTWLRDWTGLTKIFLSFSKIRKGLRELRLLAKLCPWGSQWEDRHQAQVLISPLKAEVCWYYQMVLWVLMR